MNPTEVSRDPDRGPVDSVHLRLSTYRHRGEARLDVAGELDVASAPTLAATICRISRKPHQTVLVDLGALTFCDCAGLGVLLEQHLQLREVGSTLVLLNPSPAVRRLLALTGVDQHLDIRGPHPAGPRSSGPRKGPNDRTRLSQGPSS
ncbi:MAG TPA: STAS domain-containing protein [Mycobacteriales bacterium]|jgi:anti-anti-sigma factor